MVCVLLHGWTRDCFVLILIAGHAVAYAAAADYAVEVSMRGTVGRL